MEEKSDPPDAISYKIVFRGLCSGGGPIGEAVDFALEMAEKGYLPEFSSFYMLAEGLCALNMEETLVKLIDKVMMKAKFSESEVAMIMGFLKIRKFSDALAVFGRVLNSRKPKRGYW
ncbi:UNVERIFIED_CONTAM: Pentatricopeptide repeat-containing protein, chloroplastic [Sesamum radiatum]|uniref:Pentatricopeptide repeat-containing protein, chloroplastic n=1 Tax=Sesamum radiatum TaxID=300843 RepID=A0AAW2KTE7_SESRA